MVLNEELREMGKDNGIPIEVTEFMINFDLGANKAAYEGKVIDKSTVKG